MVSRRDLLAGFAGSLPLSGKSPKIPVGAHLWVYAANQPGYDPTPVLEQVFREWSRTGIDGVELMHHALLHDDSVPRIRELAKRYRLPILGSSWSANFWKVEEREAVIGQGRTLIVRLRQVGGKYLGISVGDAGRKKTEKELDAQADVLRELCGVANAEGVLTNLHNHTYEVRDGEWDLRNTMERVPEAKLGPDFAWLYRAGIDPVDFVRRHGRRIIFAHLRQELPGPSWPETMQDGLIDYRAVAAALRETGFSGALAIELAHDRGFKPTRSYGESLRISRQYVKRTMGW